MNPKRYRKLTRFHQLKTIISDNSVFDRPYVRKAHTNRGREEASEAVKVEYTAVGAYDVMKVDWSKAIEQCRHLPKKAGHERMNQIKLKYMHLGRDLFEKGNK